MISDFIFFMLVLSVIIMAFYIKYKNNDDSISSRFLFFVLKEYPIIISIIGLYAIASYVYFKSANKLINKYNLYSNISNNSWEFVKYIKKCFDKIFNSIINVDAIKIIIIGFVVIKVLGDGNLFEKIKYIINQIKEINIKGVTIKTHEAEKEKVEVESKINNIQQQQEKGLIEKDEADQQIKNENYRKEIIAIMINSDIVVEQLYKIIKLNGKNINIPLNFIRKNVSLNDFIKIFRCQINSSSVIIEGILSEKEKLIKEVFENLWEKGIIYCEV